MRDASSPTFRHSSESPQHGTYVIASALRTLRVLRAFSAPPHRLGLAEVVEKLGIERNQAYRSLKTLEAGGFLSPTVDARFELGPAASELATGATLFASGSLVEVAAPLLDRLSEQTGETVHLFMRVGDRAVCVDKRESRQSVRLVSVLGRSLPLHAGAVPKAILAALPAEERADVLDRLDQLPLYTERTVLDRALLELELDEIASRGYSVSNEDFDASARGAGAAIVTADGTVFGGLSVGGPSFRVTDELIARFAELVRVAAQEVSRRLILKGHD